MNAPRVGPRNIMGNFSRDVLVTIWTHPGISGESLRDALSQVPAGDVHDRVATSLRNLRDMGYIENKGNRRSSAWYLVNINGAVEALCRPVRQLLHECGSRLTQDPDVVKAALAQLGPGGFVADRPAGGLRVPAGKKAPPDEPPVIEFERHHTGTAARAASAHASTAALYTQRTGPVIRAGALDALCLPSRRFGAIGAGQQLNADQVAQRLGVTVAPAP